MTEDDLRAEYVHLVYELDTLSYPQREHLAYAEDCAVRLIAVIQELQRLAGTEEQQS